MFIIFSCREGWTRFKWCFMGGNYCPFHPHIINLVYTLHTQRTKLNVFKFINNMSNFCWDNYRKHLGVRCIGPPVVLIFSSIINMWCFSWSRENKYATYPTKNTKTHTHKKHQQNKQTHLLSFKVRSVYRKHTNYCLDLCADQIFLCVLLSVFKTRYKRIEKRKYKSNI